jgi:uncharacterized protein YcbK (DUF882 family)
MNHTTLAELACKDGTAYPYPDRLGQLIAMFEMVRGLYNLPITILSAYRTPEWNRKIGGARNSQHVQGRALDLRAPNSIGLERFFSDIHSHVDEFGIRGLGLYPTFVHIDCRPSDKLIAWYGNGMKDDTGA